MIRLILSILLIGLCDGRCDLVNTQSAAKDLYGIEISRVQDSGGLLDDQVILVEYDRAKVGGAIVLVVRNKDFKEFGKFEFTFQNAGAKSGKGRARFSLANENLRRSFLKAEKHIIPLRLYFDASGKKIDASKNTTIEATSSYSLKVWAVDISFYRALFGSVNKNKADASSSEAKLNFPQSKTQEELFRSWGLMPPEGTAFFPAGGKAAVVVRSTKAFLNELEGELKKRGFLSESE